MQKSEQPEPTTTERLIMALDAVPGSVSWISQLICIIAALVMAVQALIMGLIHEWITAAASAALAAILIALAWMMARYSDQAPPGNQSNNVENISMGRGGAKL